MGATKRSPENFIFDRIIGEGSFSVVYLAKDVHSKSYYALKVCEKSHIHRENMHKAVLREKHIMKILTENFSPFFIKLFCTFQDDTRLYFTLNYCPNGELLTFINQREIFDQSAARFYGAEIILALEHLHKLGIVHRDLKPENILLNEKMHIQITDFGSALIKNDPFSDKNDPNNLKFGLKYSCRSRKNSFVGTAQYVSPEMLTSKKITPMCDLWAFACILYQMITYTPPFSGVNDYFIFQKIQNLEYSFPVGFPSDAKHLIESILKIDSSDRLAANDNVLEEGYISIRKHPYFDPLNDNWDLINQEPPAQLLAVAKTELASDNLHTENFEPGLSETQIARLLGLALHDDTSSSSSALTKARNCSIDTSSKEFEIRLKEQQETNKYHKFVENNLILKQGLIDKKKGFFPRRRMFLLTTGPHLYYVDPANMILKGEVPFSKEMRTEAKNFRNFYIHVPNRTYILEDTSNNAPGWCDAVDEAKNYIFYQDSNEDSISPSSSSDDQRGFNINRKSSTKNGLFNLHLKKMSLVEKSN